MRNPPHYVLLTNMDLAQHIRSGWRAIFVGF